MSMIFGKIIKGKGIGEKIGFPTINIPYKGKINGVFVGRVYVKKKWEKAAIHIGAKPTFDDKNRSCEAYLIDWNGNVEVGTEIKIEILEKIRDTKKFLNSEALKKQISKDVKFVRRWYNFFCYD